MEINPYVARLRMLQHVDGVQMQREATPDEETAGCPGCPYFWTCPVPHRGEEVRATPEVDYEDVADSLPSRRSFRPRDESDVGWTDTWVDEHGLTVDPDDDPDPESAEGRDATDEDTPEVPRTRDDAAGPPTQDAGDPPARGPRGRRSAGRRGLFRRRR